MRLPLLAVVSLAFGLPARAETPPSALDAIPAAADFAIRIDRPAKFVEAFLTLDAVRQLPQRAFSRDAFEGTAARRFFQLIAYFERDLGAKYPELLDRLAGRGAVFAGHYGGSKAPLLLAVTGSDEKLLQRFVALVRKVAEQEMARLEIKANYETRTVAGVEITALGDDFCYATVGPTLLLANRSEAIKAGLETLAGKHKLLRDRAEFVAADKLVPADALVRGWFDLTKPLASKQAKEIYKLPRDDALQTVLFGGWLDTIGRSKYVALGVNRTDKGMRTSVYLPAGRDDMPAGLALHVPLAETTPLLPNLAPTGVVFSSSFYLDLAAVWNQRTKLFMPKQVADLENADKRTPAFLKSLSVGKLLPLAGALHRVVIAHDADSVYKRKPEQKFPAGAFVTTMRDPALGKTLDASLRGIALFAGTQAGLKYVEEKHGDVKLIGYKFPENRDLPADRTGIRFNFSPCFATVGDQWFIASSLGMGRAVIAEIKRTAKAKPTTEQGGMRVQFHGSGVAAALNAFPDQLVTTAILDRGIAQADAAKEVRQFLDFLADLGKLELLTCYEKQAFRFDFDFQPAK